ncbi:hypothetical protein [Cupriavidus lacunae]|uniref:Uncharacterized protein n=1 Tax=Cupriavidus lacunae TaxID=2666307 RepID=A0A370NZK4_9BURK|nr:hypothetical protein [Cupriavidus lacunae]RDK10993.1 hypothetical protein DN412_06330 [Cupriavidus lacunae]
MQRVESTGRYWQLWHLSSRGMCYCALAWATLDGAAPGWRRLHPHLPLRDRYAPEKILHAAVAYKEARGEIRPPPDFEAGRMLTYAYASWSSRLRAPIPD